MNQLCLLTNLTGSDVAAWAQAIVSSIAVIVGALVVIWQSRRTRLEQNERAAKFLDGLVLLLTHLKEAALAARAEKKKLNRLRYGHPAEPSTRYLQLLEVIHQLPLEAVHGAVPMNSILTSRRVGKELQPYVGPEPELDVAMENEQQFFEYIGILDRQIVFIQDEAKRLAGGRLTSYVVLKFNSMFHLAVDRKMSDRTT